MNKIMRTGFFLPQIGSAADPQAIVQVARQAEELGYDSVWVTERVLYPLKPQTPYVATPDGSLPEPYKRVFDPVGTLTFVAAHTSRIALGTSVLDMPYYQPVMLARQLATLDVFSGGRLRIGFGQGWAKDEFDAVGASLADRGRRADEFIQVLKTIWTTDPVEFHGEFFQIPRSIIQPKPVQKPHPPIYLAAYSPGALQRVAAMANGWHPVNPPLDALQQTMSQLKHLAQAAGRDPATLGVVLRANLMVTPQPLGKGRWTFSGTWEEIGEDVHAIQAQGVDELIFDPTFSPDCRSKEDFLRIMEQVRTLV
jgi:probable F420-dependent oxidoreductase